MLGGLWEFPGGIIEQGQDPELALKQKVYEECGVQTKIFKKVGFIDHAFSHFKMRLNGYFCKEEKYFFDENKSRKWISKKNKKDYYFPKQINKFFKLSFILLLFLSELIPTTFFLIHKTFFFLD